MISNGTDFLFVDTLCHTLFVGRRKIIYRSIRLLQCFQIIANLFTDIFHHLFKCIQIRLLCTAFICLLFDFFLRLRSCLAVYILAHRKILTNNRLHILPVSTLSTESRIKIADFFPVLRFVHLCLQQFCIIIIFLIRHSTSVLFCKCIQRLFCNNIFYNLFFCGFYRFSVFHTQCHSCLDFLPCYRNSLDTVNHLCSLPRKSGNNCSKPEKGSSSPYGHPDSRQNKHGKNCCSCSPFKRSLSLVHVMFWLICIRFLYNVITDFTDCIG